MKAGSDVAPKASTPKGTVSGSHRGRVLRRANAKGGWGAIPNAEKSLKRSVVNRKVARGRRRMKRAEANQKRGLNTFLADRVKGTRNEKAARTKKTAEKAMAFYKSKR